MSAKERQTCPVCGEKVLVSGSGRLRSHPYNGPDCEGSYHRAKRGQQPPMSEPKNQHLPKWARELVSDDVAWLGSQNAIVCRQVDHCGEMFNLRVERFSNTTAIEIASADQDLSLWPNFPSPQAAVQVAEAFIRGLRSEDLR